MSEGRATSNHALRGISWMLAACLLSALTGGLVRQLSGAISSMELVFFRNVITLLMLMPWLLYKGVGSMRTSRLALYSLRTVFAYLAMLLSFFAFGNLPIADVFSLQLTIPLFTIVLAVMVLGQHADVRTWIACAVGLGGALLIVRPGFIELSLAAVAALASAMLSGGSNTAIKLLSRTESAGMITVYANLLMLPLSLVPALFFWVTPGWDQIPFIVGIGLASGITGYCFTRAVAAADARVVQPFQFSRILFATAIGFLMFAELPGIWTWAGAIIIFASSSYILHVEATRRAEAADGVQGGKG